MTKVTEETKLIDDLGLDSLSIMLFAMEIEAAFNFRFTEPVRFWPKSKTVSPLGVRITAMGFISSCRRMGSPSCGISIERSLFTAITALRSNTGSTKES